MKPSDKKRIASHLIELFNLSERAACQLSGVSRTAFRYRPRTKADNTLRERLKRLATEYPRYGYLMLHGLLKAEGLVRNKKHTYRIYNGRRAPSSHQKAEENTAAKTSFGSTVKAEPALVYGLCFRSASQWPTLQNAECG